MSPVAVAPGIFVVDVMTDPDVLKATEVYHRTLAVAINIRDHTAAFAAAMNAANLYLAVLEALDRIEHPYLGHREDQLRKARRKAREDQVAYELRAWGFTS
jgi:hypothetical protein